MLNFEFVFLLDKLKLLLTDHYQICSHKDCMVLSYWPLQMYGFLLLYNQAQLPYVFKGVKWNRTNQFLLKKTKLLLGIKLWNDFIFFKRVIEPLSLLFVIWSHFHLYYLLNKTKVYFALESKKNSTMAKCFQLKPHLLVAFICITLFC